MHCRFGRDARQCRSVARGAARLCDERLNPVAPARAGPEAAGQKLSSGSATGDKPTPDRGQAAKAPRTANRQPANAARNAITLAASAVVRGASSSCSDGRSISAWSAKKLTECQERERRDELVGDRQPPVSHTTRLTRLRTGLRSGRVADCRVVRRFGAARFVGCTQRVDAQVRRPPVCARVRRGRRARHARGAACGGWRSGAAG